MRIYGFIRNHSRAAALAVAAVLCAEAAFICWQKLQYEQFVEDILKPGIISNDMLLTSAEVDDGVFARLDRLHVTLASSLYSSDPSASPLTLDIGLSANFTPLGLSGDIFILNATSESAKFLNKFEGTHPRLTLRWRHALTEKAVKVTAESPAFDMRLSEVKPGVGPISLRLASTAKGSCTVALTKEESMNVSCRIPDVTAEVADPAANLTTLKASNASFTAVMKPKDSGANLDGLWYVEHASAKASAVDFNAGDWRGELGVGFKAFSLEVMQDPSARDGHMDGNYDVRAEDVAVAVTSHQYGFKRSVDGSNFLMKLKAADVPLELFDSIEDQTIAETLDSSGPMHFELNALGFNSGKGDREKTSVSGVLDVKANAAKKNLETHLELSADIPDAVLDLIEVIVRGARPDMRSESLKSFMTPKNLPEGRIWQLRMKETRDGTIAERTFSLDAR